MKKDMTKIIYILAALFFFIASAYFVGIFTRYTHWHFFVHKELTLVLDAEFRKLMNKYAANDNFASIEGKNMRGIIIDYPVKKRFPYNIQLRLEKNLLSNSFAFKAEISSPDKKSHYDTGNPPIYMEIPMQYFEKVIDGGLEEDQINALIVTAMKKNWESTKLNTEIRRQPPIVLEYK